MEQAANIMNAVRLLDAAGQEIEALGEALGRMLTELDEDAAVAFDEDDERADYDGYLTPSEWLYNGTRWNFPAKRRRKGPGKRPVAGALTVAADLGGDDRPARALGVPCFIVAWGVPDDGWEEDLDDGDFWPRGSDSDDLKDERLFRYVGDEEYERDAPNIEVPWFYIVPLLAIKGTDRLRALVVEPVCRLLDGEPAARAFRDAPEVLRFAWQDGEPRLVTPSAG